MRPFRLLLYTDAEAFGGAEAVLQSLIEELDPAIETVLLATSEQVASEIASGLPAVSVETLAKPKDKRDWRAITAHVGTIRRLEPDLVQLNLQAPWAGQYGLLGALLTRTPAIAVEHTVLPFSSVTQRRIRRLLCSRLAAHVSVGYQAARQVEANIGLPQGSVRTIHNGVADVALHPPSPLFDGFTVGTIGRHAHSKGLDVLLRALVDVPEASAVMLSDGPERPQLEALAKELGVADRVTMPGWVPSPRDYLPTFDLVALPSRTEGFPLVVIEAMLAERPVVASNVGSVSEAVANGETGVVVPPDDPDALAQALAELASDSERRQGMGRQARAHALRDFTAAAMARRYEQLYEEVL